MVEKTWRQELSLLASRVEASALYVYRSLPQKTLVLAYRFPGNGKEAPFALDPHDAPIREIFSADKPLSGERTLFPPPFSLLPAPYLLIGPLKHQKKIVGMWIAGKTRRISQTVLDRFCAESEQLSLKLALLDLEEQKKELSDRAAALEKKLNAAYRRILESDKLVSLGRFAGGLAHELNTPLGAIQTYAEYLDLSVKGETEIESIEGILKAVGHCKEIIDNVLRLSRERKPVQEPVWLEQVLRDALLLASPDMEKRNIRVISHIPHEIPPVLGDHTRLVQLATNLLVNARDAVSHRRLVPREGTIRLTLSREDAFNVLEVSDNGPGIPEKDLGRIFDPFFTTKEVGEGIGLGLSICQTIVEEHRGKIEIVAEEGKGTHVLVKIPIHVHRQEHGHDKEENADAKAINRGR